MSIAEDFKQFLIIKKIGNANNISISRSPAVNIEKDDNFTIVAQGGFKSGGNVLQWKSTYNLLLIYRNRRGEELYKKDELLLNLNGCISLTNYKIARAVINPMSEIDLGINEVHVGQWNIQLEIIKK